MPPLPLPLSTSASDPPNDDIAAALRSLNLRQAHLSTSISALAQSTSSLRDQQMLSAQLSEDLDDYGRAVESLEALVEDLERERERVAWRVVVHDWASKYARLKIDARTALLTSKRIIDTNTKSRRDELLSGGVLVDSKPSNENAEDALMRTTHTLTTALQRTEQRLRSELERSVLTTQLLQSSTSTLRQTSNAHSNLTSLLDTSRGLITALERTDWFDRFLIFLALAVFIATCAWVVKVRVVDRALWLGFWWVKYLPFPRQGGNAEVELGKKMEGRSTGSVEEVVTTTLAPMVSIAVGAVGANATEFIKAVIGNITDTLESAIATGPTDMASPHRGEL